MFKKKRNKKENVTGTQDLVFIARETARAIKRYISAGDFVNLLPSVSYFNTQCSFYLMSLGLAAILWCPVYFSVLSELCPPPLSRCSVLAEPQPPCSSSHSVWYTTRSPISCTAAFLSFLYLYMLTPLKCANVHIKSTAAANRHMRKSQPWSQTRCLEFYLPEFFFFQNFNPAAFILPLKKTIWSNAVAICQNQFCQKEIRATPNFCKRLERADLH